MKRAVIGLTALALTLLFAFPASASIFFQHNLPDVKWQTFETEHFIIHYYEGTRSKSHPNTTKFTARRVAKYAEIMYPKVCEQFDYFLKEKVHVVVRDQEDYSNGFALYQTDFVTVWAQPLYYPLRGRIDWIPDVMTHEFAHIVSLKANESRGVGASLAGIPAGALIEDNRNNLLIGAEVPLFMGSEAPFWWTEGGAEFWTHYVGYNDWGSSRDALLRTSILDEDATLTLDELAIRFDKTGLDGERGYNHGYSIGLYLAEKYGQETYAKFAEASREGGRFSWDSIIEDVLGITPEQMWAGWLEWARARYGRMKEEIMAQGLHEGEELALSPPPWVSDPDAWKKLTKKERKKTREATGIYSFPFISRDGKVWGMTSRTGRQISTVDVEEYHAFSGDWYLSLTDAERERQKELGKAEAGAALTEEEKVEKKALVEKTERTEEEQARLDELIAQPKARKLTAEEKAEKEALTKKTEEKKELGEKIKNQGRSFNCLSGQSGLPSFNPDSSKWVISATRVKDWYGDYELDGYEWHDLWVVDLAGMNAKYKDKEKAVKVPQRVCKKFTTRITKNLRAFSPAWSPDGEWIAFLVYGDGTYQMWKVKPDGTEMTQVTKFPEGTLAGEPTWSPDSSKLAFYVYKPHRQDIWVASANGDGAHPVTWDLAEDKDPFWAGDGHLYWSSDRTGIFNIYKMNVETRDVWQVTNVIGGAHAPKLTASGHLLYTNFTAFGFKVAGLKKENFYNKHIGNGTKATAMRDGVATNGATVAYELPSDDEAATWVKEEEELPDITSAEFKPGKYNPFWRGVQPPLVIPIVVAEDFNIKAGADMIIWDSTNKHALFLEAVLGRDRNYVVQYVNFMSHVDLFFTYARFERRRGSGISIDDQGRQFTGDLKTGVKFDFWVAGASKTVGPRLDLSSVAIFRTFDQGGSTDSKIDIGNPFTFGEKGISNTFTLANSVDYHTINPGSFRGNMDINPRGGREIHFGYNLDLTRLRGLTGDGFDIDDGQRLNEYLAQTFTVAYAEYFAAPWMAKQEHTLQFTFQGAWIDQNVHFNDELFAGGQHPYRAFGDLNVNSQFAGYPQFSLLGETMLVGSIAYRVPLVRDVDKKFGPFYLDSIFLQVFGTAGNLWGYRPAPTDAAGNPVARNGGIYDPGILNGGVESANIREFPFVGLFSKEYRDRQERNYQNVVIPGFDCNGPCNYGKGDNAITVYDALFPVSWKNGNRLLTDVGLEMRVKSYVHNYSFWYSFVRLAYGFNQIGGLGDVDGDGVGQSANQAQTDVKPGGLRFYIGLGTGW